MLRGRDEFPSLVGNPNPEAQGRQDFEEQFGVRIHTGILHVGGCALLTACRSSEFRPPNTTFSRKRRRTLLQFRRMARAVCRLQRLVGRRDSNAPEEVRATSMLSGTISKPPLGPGVSQLLTLTVTMTLLFP